MFPDGLPEIPALTADEEGFLYPKVNEEMCMDCGLCENVCPMLHKPQQHEVLAVYGAKNNDDAVRFTSSSGGMFTLFAEEILKQGGVVVGAALDEQLNVQHVLVDSIADLPKLRGSKYVQSIGAGTAACTVLFAAQLNHVFNLPVAIACYSSYFSVILRLSNFLLLYHK